MNSKTDKTIIVSMFGISLILAFKSIFSNICFRLINPFLNLLSACQKPLPHTNLAFRELKPHYFFFFLNNRLATTILENAATWGIFSIFSYLGFILEKSSLKTGSHLSSSSARQETHNVAKTTISITKIVRFRLILFPFSL